MMIPRCALLAAAITFTFASAAQADSSMPPSQVECLLLNPFRPGCPPLRHMDMVAMAMGNLETKALRCGYSAAPLGAALDAWMRQFSGADQADLNMYRAPGRAMNIDPYTLDCAEVATMLRRWRSDLLREARVQPSTQAPPSAPATSPGQPRTSPPGFAASADYSGIRRGQKTAEACFVKDSGQEDCIFNAMHQTASDDFVSTGFAYVVFIVRALDEERLRNNTQSCF